MNRLNIDEAMWRLQRAYWFFNGFAAARPASIDEGNGSHARLQETLEGVSEWLAGVQDGRRLIAPGNVDEGPDSRGNGETRRRDDGGLLVITYAELEKIIDGTTRNPSRQDRQLAAQTALNILAEFKTEQEAFLYDDNVPF